MNKLLEWNPSGFSVHAEQIVYEDETQKLENLALYLTRAPIKIGGITQTPEGRVSVTTPSHPLTGNILVLDVLDWIHAICQRIPDRGQHLYRYYGAYSNRTRNALPPNDGSQTGVTVPEPPDPDFDKPYSHGRASWARLIRKVFEVDPKVVDRIILHLPQTDPATAPRAPPATSHLLS